MLQPPCHRQLHAGVRLTEVSEGGAALETGAKMTARENIDTLARIIHEFPTASVESTAPWGPSPSGLLDVLLKYACVGLRSEGPETTALSTLSRRQPMNNAG
jgi:hypothetical protein